MRAHDDACGFVKQAGVCTLWGANQARVSWLCAGFQEAGHRHLDDGKAAAAAAAAAAAGGSFWGGFVNGVGMIIATEIGDKTFFLAAVMAMQHSRLLIFTGALSALAVMTILSAALGFALPNLLPREYTHYAGAVRSISLLERRSFLESA